MAGVVAILCVSSALLCISVSGQLADRDSTTGVLVAAFERHENHLLSAGAEKSSREDSSLDCALVCTGFAWCWSYNFQKTADKNDKHLCELLSTDRFRNSVHFVAHGDFNHFSMKVRTFRCIRALPQLGGKYTVAEVPLRLICFATF